MALLERYKVHDQTGSFKLTMPIEWVKRNEIAHKDELDVIVSGAIMVLPPHEVDENEMEEIIRDFRAMVQIRNKMRSYQSMTEIRD